MDGKVLFVTGGNAGIGLATALKFAADGVNVALFSRRADANRAAEAKIRDKGVACLSFTGDVTDEAALSRALRDTAQALGGLHYAFNNAGASQRPVLLTELTVEDYRALDTNILGTFLGMKYQVPLIQQSGGGAICNNASAAGLVGVASSALYAASKFGVIGLTKSAAMEFAASNVRINVVCPGVTASDMFRQYRDAAPDLAARVAAAHPLNRTGEPEEVAAAVLYLCRDATFTTGHALCVDGGLTVP